MPKLKTQEQFEEDVRKMYPNGEYIVIGEYVNSKTKVMVKHTVCGKEYMVNPQLFLRSRGCRECSYKIIGDKKRKPVEKLVKEIDEIHGIGEYTLLGEYKNCETPTEFLHRECGKITNMTTASLLAGCGCIECSNKRNGINQRKSHEQYVKEVYLFNPNINIISTYIKQSDRITAECKICGHIWKPYAGSLTNSNHPSGCPVCGINKNKHNHEWMLSQLSEKYGNEYTPIGKYQTLDSYMWFIHNNCGRKSYLRVRSLLERVAHCDYCDQYGVDIKTKYMNRLIECANGEYEFLEEYNGCSTKISVLHNKCNRTYSVTPSDFFSGYRCPYCTVSRGEDIILNFLETYNINFDHQKKFDNLLGIGGRKLAYDFYLPNKNILIEVNGIQHSEYSPFFHRTKDAFEKQIEHDKRKREYAIENNIDLITIWHYEIDKIENILKDKLNIA